MRNAGTSPMPMNAGKPADTTEAKMAQHLRIATTSSVTRRLGDFVETETAADIFRSIDLIRSLKGAQMTMVAGGSGIGKTMAIDEYRRHNDATYMSIACGEFSAWNFAKSYFGHFRQPPHFNCLADARKLMAVYTNPDQLLLIDEAHHLTVTNPKTKIDGESFNWLVDVAQECNLKVVFCGDHNLANFVEKTDRMSSRMRRPIVISKPSQRDVHEIARGMGFETKECLAALCSVSNLTGGLRNVENVIQIALAFVGDDVPTTAHLKAAIVDMKLDTRRTRR